MSQFPTLPTWFGMPLAWEMVDAAVPARVSPPVLAIDLVRDLLVEFQNQYLIGIDQIPNNLSEVRSKNDLLRCWIVLHL